MAEWRAVQCQPQREALVREGLEAWNIPGWYPYRLVRCWHPIKRQAYKARRPYFPGYCFVDIAGERWLQWRVPRLPGAIALLGERPIPDEVMVALMAKAEPDGEVRDPPIKPGDAVTIGVLVGTLVSLDNHKAAVLVSLLGAMRSVQVSITALSRDHCFEPA